MADRKEKRERAAPPQSDIERRIAEINQRLDDISRHLVAKEQERKSELQFPIDFRNRRIINRDLPVIKSVDSTGLIFTVELNDREYEWDMTPASGGGWTTVTKTANYTAAADEEVLCDTATTGAFTVTLPATPSGGDRVRIVDSRGNFAAANLTVGRNGQTIRGAASNLILSKNNANYEFVYNGTDSDWEYMLMEPANAGGAQSVTFVIGPASNADSADYDYTTDGTDDHVQIQAAIDALPATGGEIRLREGTFTLGASVTIAKSGVTIRGVGYGTKIIPKTSLNADMFVLGDASVQYTFCQFSDILFDGNQANVASGDIITNIATQSILPLIIERCWFENADDKCIDSNGDTFVSRCVFKNFLSGSSSVPAISGNIGTGELMVVSECYFSTTSTSTAYVSATGNINFVDCVFVIPNSYNTTVAQGGKYTGCLFSVGTSVGSSCVIISGSPTYVYDCQILEDSIDSSADHASKGISGAGVYAGNIIEGMGIAINLTGTSTVTGNYINGPDANGIILDDADNCVISDNRIMNPGQGTDNTYDAILLNAGSDRNIITSNRVRSALSTNHRYGINISAATCDNNVVSNNILTDAQTGQFNDAGTGTVTDGSNVTT